MIHGKTIPHVFLLLIIVAVAGGSGGSSFITEFHGNVNKGETTGSGGTETGGTTFTIDAGQDQIIQGRGVVALSATTNFPLENLIFNWTVPQESNIQLSNPDSSAPSFNAPDNLPFDETYEISVEVENPDGLLISDTVNVHILVNSIIDSDFILSP